MWVFLEPFLGSAKKLCSLSWCPGNALRLHLSTEPPRRHRPGIPVLEVNSLLLAELLASGRLWFLAHSQGEEGWDKALLSIHSSL